MAFFAKQLSGQLAPEQILFYRGLISLIILTPIAFKNHGLSFPKSISLVVWARAFIGTCSVFLYFMAIPKLGVTLSTLLIDMSPVFVAVLGFLFLKERLGGKELICIFAVIIGNTIYLTKGTVHVEWHAYIYGILGAATLGLSHTLLKVSTRHSNSIQIIWTYSFVLSLIMGLASFTKLSEDVLTHSNKLIIVGICGLTAQYFLTKSFSLLKASVAGVLSLSGVIWAVLIDVILLKATFSLQVYLSMSIILAGIVGLKWANGRSNLGNSKTLSLERHD